MNRGLQLWGSEKKGRARERQLNCNIQHDNQLNWELQANQEGMGWISHGWNVSLNVRSNPERGRRISWVKTHPGIRIREVSTHISTQSRETVAPSLTKPMFHTVATLFSSGMATGDLCMGQKHLYKRKKITIYSRPVDECAG